MHRQDPFFCKDQGYSPDIPVKIIVTPLSKKKSQKGQSKKTSNSGNSETSLSFSIDHFGGTFTLNKDLFPKKKIGSIRIQLMDKSGKVQYQTLELDASCKSPLVIRDQFGALKVSSYSNGKQGLVGCV